MMMMMMMVPAALRVRARARVGTGIGIGVLPWFVLVALALTGLGALGNKSAEALRHNYVTKRDHRGLIGPLGFPFGFLDTGHYNLTVFDFELYAPKHKHRHDDGKVHHHDDGDGDGDGDGSSNANGELLLSDVLDNIKGVGFLLKAFNDEASFFQYMDFIAEDPGRCIFQNYLDSKQDDPMDEFDQDDFKYYDNGYDDDDYYPDYFDDDENYGDDEGNRYRYRLLQMQTQRQMQMQMQTKRENKRNTNTNTKTNAKMRRTEDKDAGNDTDDGFGVGDAFYRPSGELDGIFLDMLPRSRWKPNRPTVSYNFEPGQAGLYFLIYQVCYDIEEGSRAFLKDDNLYDIHSRFELDFHFSNKDMFGRVSYLSRGEMILPWMFFLFSLIYAVCLYIWYTNLQRIKDGQSGFFDSGDASPPAGAIGLNNASESPTIYPIHYLMGVLLALKFFSLLFESIRYHYLRVTGHAVFFSAVYYIFAFLKGMTLFTVILLIGSGWSFVKPFLSEREKKMIFGILVLQVVNNIALVVLTQETEGERAFDKWTAVLHLVDIICCCAVLIPIVWQVNQLEKNMEQNQHKGKDDYQDQDQQHNGAEEGSFINGDDQVPEDELDEVARMDDEDDETEPIPDARLAAKLKLFRSFYLLVIGYVYMTRIVVYLFASQLNYKHTWMRIFVVEFVTIAFYCSVGYMFRPMVENPYTHIRRRRGDSGEGTEVEMPKIDTSTKIALD